MPRLTRRTFLTRSALTLAATQLRTAFALPTAPPPQPSPLGAVRVHPASDLAHRTAQNFARLRDPIYRPPLVFRQTNWQSWPGDFEGRALLALTLLARATGDVPEYLPTLPAIYREHLNPHGYFGPALDLHAINEQQLSGHGWYLRALCEYHDFTSNAPNLDPAERAQTLAQIAEIIQNLALPLRGAYAQYPIDPALRAAATAPANPGAVDGHLAAQHGIWAVSSDTGCAFIFLDGLTHAWVTLRDANSPLARLLKSLIDEAIARFTATDLVAIKAQTHASLTALRALMRVYENTPANSPEASALLTTIQARYNLYRTAAMTEHYANTNWFGRPDSWTEPCAIIDSFILATQLWQHTANPAYLEDAHRIWFNGLGRGLRANGGFGTDTCPGATPFVHVRSYEAYFCCTMRGGEAHARAAQHLYFTHPSGNVTTNVSVRPDAGNDRAHEDLSLRPSSAQIKNLSLRPDPTHPKTLSFRPEARRAEVEKPASAPADAHAPAHAPAYAHPHLQNLSFRPKRSEVEKPASAPADAHGPAHAPAYAHPYLQDLSFRPERSEVEKPASAPAQPFGRPTLTLPFYAPSTLRLEPLTGHNLLLRQTTNYPYTGTVTLNFLPADKAELPRSAQESRHSGAQLQNLRISPAQNSPRENVSFRPESRSEAVEKPASAPAPSPGGLTLRLFAPSWTSSHRLVHNGHPLPHTLENGFLTVHLTPHPNDTLTLTQTLRVAPRDPISPYTPAGSWVFEAGPLILARTPPEDPSATLRSPNPTPIAIPRNAHLEPLPTPAAAQPTTGCPIQTPLGWDPATSPAGCRPTPISYRVRGTDTLLSPINDLNTTPDPNPNHPHPRQILFRPT